MKEIITTKGINKAFCVAPDFSWSLLKNVDIVIYQGEFTVITGPSGCGKSTLLQIMLGYDMEASGNVTIDNVDIKGISQEELEKFRNENIGIGIDRKTPIDPESTVIDNISRRLASLKNINVKNEVEEILKTFNLNFIADQKVIAGSKDYYRLVLAMAFCGSPPIIFIDEILDYFPYAERQELLASILSIQKKHQITVVMITTEIEIITKADRAFCIKDELLYKVDLEKLRKLTGAN